MPVWASLPPGYWCQSLQTWIIFALAYSWTDNIASHSLEIWEIGKNIKYVLDWGDVTLKKAFSVGLRMDAILRLRWFENFPMVLENIYKVNINTWLYPLFLCWYHHVFLKAKHHRTFRFFVENFMLTSNYF